MTRFELVVATRNEGKRKEFRRILGRRIPCIGLFSLNDFPGAPAVRETKATLEGNAVLKAESAAKFTGLPALADDSGLFVNALGGKPGAKSARYSGPKASDASNRRKLLRQMKGKKTRGAVFKCVVAVATPEGKAVFAKGIARGRIVQEERGRRCFGYDSVFVPCGYGKTFAELGPRVKDRLSHRARALEKIVPIIRKIIS